MSHYPVTDIEIDANVEEDSFTSGERCGSDLRVPGDGYRFHPDLDVHLQGPAITVSNHLKRARDGT